MDMGDSLGKAVLRLTVGGLLLLHGVHKLAGRHRADRTDDDRARAAGGTRLWCLYR